MNSKKLNRYDTESKKEPRYILITEGLQNDFFLHPAKSLCLPEEEVHRLLVGYETNKIIKEKEGEYILPRNFPEDGPLENF